jgi:hypothetical protein
MAGSTSKSAKACLDSNRPEDCERPSHQTPRQVRLHPSSRTRSLWKHHTRDIVFALVVDDFGSGTPIRTTPPPPPRAQQIFTVTEDGSVPSSASLSVGLHQTNRPALHARLHPAALVSTSVPKYPTHSPHFFKTPVYGAKVQYAEDTPDSPLLNARERTHIQRVIGVCVVVVPMRRHLSMPP